MLTNRLCGSIRLLRDHKAEVTKIEFMDQNLLRHKYGIFNSYSWWNWQTERKDMTWRMDGLHLGLEGSGRRQNSSLRLDTALEKDESSSHLNQHLSSTGSSSTRVSEDFVFSNHVKISSS